MFTLTPGYRVGDPLCKDTVRLGLLIDWEYSNFGTAIGSFSAQDGSTSTTKMVLNYLQAERDLCRYHVLLLRTSIRNLPAKFWKWLLLRKMQKDYTFQ